MAEIADGPSLFHSQKDFPFSTVSCIRSDGNRRRGPPRRSSASRRINEDENETPQSSSNGKKSNASDQEEIIALFRRIQSSISKGESVSTKKTNSNESKDKPSPDLILEALRKSRKQIKGDAGECHVTIWCCYGNVEPIFLSPAILCLSDSITQLLPFLYQAFTCQNLTFSES